MTSLLLGGVCALVAAAPEPIVPTDSPKIQWVTQQVRVKAGDDPAWASPTFDDSAWALEDTRLPPGTSIDGWAGIGWFRFWIEVPAGQATPLAMYSRWVGAAEIYVDGERQLAIGDLSAVAAGGSTPVDYDSVRLRWLKVPGPGRRLVAVRFASQHLAAMHRVGMPAGFEVALSRIPVDRMAGARGRLAPGAFIGATAALALLHLLLFLFHRARRENLHYALAALGVATITATQEFLGDATTAFGAVALLTCFHAAIAVSAVLLLRFYYAALAPSLPRWFWGLAVAGGVIAAASWAVPRAVVYGFATLVSLEQARVLVTAVIRRVSGAWIIGLGGVLWVVGAALQMLGDTGVVPFFPEAYLYGFLALLGSSSVYLARDIARDKDDLARKLVEIEKLSEKERQAMQRYRTIFETTGTGTIIFGDDATISLANDEWSQLTGYSRQEIEGVMPWMAFFSEQSLERMRGYHRLRSTHPEAAPRSYEAQLKDRKGRLHDGVVTIAMVPGTDQRVGSFLDLSDLKRAQQQMFRADKMAALGQIIAGVAHEINNPNNFIHFNLPILRRYVEAMRPHLERQLEQDPALRLLNMPYEVFFADLLKLLENMEHGSQRITSIVADLRHYIRGGEDGEREPGSIAAVIDRVMTLVGKQVRKMVKQFDVTVAEGLPKVRMNAGKIEQVLINLVINAGQAADKEQSWVRLTARATGARDAVEILVEDNGTGIPAENLDQIFEPFFTSKGRETGTGLGLSISQQIVEEHGGRISVTSTPGQGSCFTVSLPAVPAD